MILSTYFPVPSGKINKKKGVGTLLALSYYQVLAYLFCG